MIEIYTNLIQVTEEITRVALKSLDLQIKKHNINNITSKECFLLYNIGNSTAISIKSLKQSFFVGTNPSYVLKKMVEYEYICTIPDKHDSRQLNINLTDKGKELYKKIKEVMENELKFLIENDLSDEIIKKYNGFFKKFKNILLKKISNEMIIV